MSTKRLNPLRHSLFRLSHFLFSQVTLGILDFDFLKMYNGQNVKAGCELMQESGEMYLETILALGKKNNLVRAVDISNEMGISKASVSRALARLKSQSCIIVDSDGHIAFTEKGRRIAEAIFHRHQVLTEFFMALGVDRETASADACKIEHDISEKTFNAMRDFLQSQNRGELAEA